VPDEIQTSWRAGTGIQAEIDRLRGLLHTGDEAHHHTDGLTAAEERTIARLWRHTPLVVRMREVAFFALDYAGHFLAAHLETRFKTLIDDAITRHERDHHGSQS